MTRLSRFVAPLGLLLLFALIGLFHVHETLRVHAGHSPRIGGLIRGRNIAVSFYHKARNLSLAATARALGTSSRSDLSGTAAQRGVGGLRGKADARDAAGVGDGSPSFAEAGPLKSADGVVKHTHPAFTRHVGNLSSPMSQRAGSKALGLNFGDGWNSSCAQGQDVPRPQDLPWPMYRLTDGSLGIRPRFPWGSTSGLDDEGFRQGFRFYLYEDGPFNMTDFEDCFRAKWKLPARGSRLSFEGLDSKMSHENRMYLLEIFLWQSIRDHPMRTTDPEKAGLFIIGYAPILLDWSQPCEAGGDKPSRERQIHDALTSSRYFQRKNGSDHLFLWTRYNLKPDRMLRQLLDSGPIVAVLERSFFMLQRKWPLAFERGSVVMMPYVSSGFIDTDDDTREKDSEKPYKRYFFRGNMKRHGEGLERQTFLPGLAKMLESADFMHRKVNVGKDKLTVYTDLLNETSSELRRAGMCPCPEGDSPTTLRPFEALAAGCVPVFFVEKEVIAYDIPFPSLIDWDSIAFFARSMAEIGQCDHGQRETFKFLDALGGSKASAHVVETVQGMRRAGKEVFRRHFSFLQNPSGVVSSMLYEARELTRRGTGHNIYQKHLRYLDLDDEFQLERDKQHHLLEVEHTKIRSVHKI